MADQEHVAKLKEGVPVWNEWREDNPDISVDLSGADLRGANLIRADLRHATIVGANLSRADLSKADLYRADLSKANLSGADLIGANLSRADLSEASIIGAKLSRANLSGANLIEADLYRANLSGAELIGANLSRADLSEADLYRADLSEANLRRVNLSKALLCIARLIGAALDGAILHEAHLWETQRSRWSIKRIQCESVYWDREAKEITCYTPGEFERLYSEQPRIELFYKDGLTKFEVNTLPALLKHLADLHPEGLVRLRSVQETAGGATVSIVVENADSSTLEALASKAEQSQRAQLALREDPVTQVELEKRLDRFLSDQVIPLMWEKLFPQVLQHGGQHVHIEGPATGIVIASGRSHVNAKIAANDLLSLLPALDEVSRQSAELALSKQDSARLAEAVQSVKQEAQTSEPKRSMLDSSVKVFKEIAIKVAGKAVENTVPEHLWRPLHDHLMQIVHVISHLHN